MPDASISSRIVSPTSKNCTEMTNNEPSTSSSSSLSSGNNQNSPILENGTTSSTTATINSDENLSYSAGSGDNSIIETPSYDSEYFIEKLTTTFFEKNESNNSYPGIATIRILKIKPVKESVKVNFEEKIVELRFKTSDNNFLLEHKQRENTVFVWRTKLNDEIIPNESTFDVKSAIEIHLKKKDGKKKWDSFAPTEHKKTNPVTNAVKKKPPTTPSSSRFSQDCDEECDFYDVSSADSNANERSSYGVISGKWKSEPKPSPPSAPVVSPGFTGLRNIGNTCFMNASLQALLNTTELKEYFTQDFHFLDINTDNPLGMKGELAMEFGNFVKDMWSGFYRAQAPSSIKRLVAYKANQFANFAQHDAQEFLVFLLDTLHEDLNRVAKKPQTESIESDGRPDSVVAQLSWRNYLLRDNSIIIDLFHGQLKSRLHCPECKRVSITFDPFLYLPIPFPKLRNNSILTSYPPNETDSTTEDNTETPCLKFQGEEKTRYDLYELLQYFAETETLGPEEAWYCNKCKKHQEAEKTLLLWSLPPLLIIQLKRFCYTGHIFRNKIEIPVDYPINGLNLARYLCSGAPAQCTIYDLYAVVCHFGSVYGGHYVSYGRLMELNSKEKEKTNVEWRYFDDSDVKTASEAEVVDKKAYLLFYKRRDVASQVVIDKYREVRETIAQKKKTFELKRPGLTDYTNGRLAD